MVVHESVKKLDLAVVVDHLLAEMPHLAGEEIVKIESDYRLFLNHVRDNPQTPHVPGIQVDQLWHHHILFTKKYAEDCEKIAGTFVHHTPGKTGNAPRGINMADCCCSCGIGSSCAT